MTRTAISPRLAIRIFSAVTFDRYRQRLSHRCPVRRFASSHASQRNIAVFLRRVAIPFGLELASAAMSFGRVMRGWMISSTNPRDAAMNGFANFSRNSATGSRAWRPGRPPASSSRSIEDVDGALGAHHRNLGGRIREIEIRPHVLARHDAVGAAVGLARNNGDLRHGRFGKRIEQLGAVRDDAAVLLLTPGRNPGTSSKVISGMLKASQKRTNRAALTEASISSTPARYARLIGHDADRPPSQPRESHHDVFRVVLVNFNRNVHQPPGE